MKYNWLVKPFFWFQKKKYGSVLAPTWEWGKAPRAMISFLLFYKSLIRKGSPLPAELRALVGYHVAEKSGCGFCMNFNSKNLKFEKRIELKQFRTSALFSEKERAALEYAEMMTIGEVDMKIHDSLRRFFPSRLSLS